MDPIPFHIVKEHFADLLRWKAALLQLHHSKQCQLQHVVHGSVPVSSEHLQRHHEVSGQPVLASSLSQSPKFFLTFKLNFLYLSMCQLPLVLSLSTTKSLLKTAPSVPGMSQQWWRRWRITSRNLLAMHCLMRRRHTGNTTLVKYVHSNTLGLFFPVSKTVSIFFCSFSM